MLQFIGNIILKGVGFKKKLVITGIPGSIILKVVKSRKIRKTRKYVIIRHKIHHMHKE